MSDPYRSRSPSFFSQLIQALSVLILGFFLGVAFAAHYLIDRTPPF